MGFYHLLKNYVLAAAGERTLVFLGIHMVQFCAKTLMFLDFALKEENNGSIGTTVTF